MSRYKFDRKKASGSNGLINILKNYQFYQYDCMKKLNG